MKSLLAELNMRYFNSANRYRLKLVLVEKKRTGVWLAQELGVSPVTISKWCSNITQPSLSTLSKIADLLEIDPRVLLNGKE